ncbi:tyrosine-type recombinase/integrase [Marinobacterium lutimaris]|uniref:Site-specific recombinase XerD n=1 Tax=Marinobacterium lutimaris TaxID=568106 RepID=A0A1H5XQN1_9GAMM|nr:tyrosine-type recombinase/integrase [Marinobacterium lutimaris]SEG14004.1 Site-specific recombinase XerD [Marinobacterium lutimaris]
MVRPKKDRFFNGIKLEDNLYPDNRGRDGHWRYMRPDGTFRHFNAETTEAANQIASHNNARRENYTGPKKRGSQFGTLAHYVDEFIDHREEQSPDLKAKGSWQNRCYALRQFTRTITKPLARLTRADIDTWWTTLSHHQQKLRHAEFRKFFNYLMGRQLLPNMDYNPFTTADDKPRLYTRSKPKRKTKRLTIEGFWRIYTAAGELGYTGLQVAMGISLLTGMREGDIVDLRLDKDVADALMRRVIGKSANQKGDYKAARLSWNMGSYDLLRQLVQRARELSLQNRRCPFVVSQWPKQRRMGKTKTHMAQVTTRRLISMFDESRKAAGFTGENEPTFHSVRSLFDKLASDAGYDIKLVQHAMAHSSEEMTREYLEGHELPFEPVDIVFTEKQIGGNFG